MHHVDSIPDMVTIEEYPTTGGNDVANKQIMITGGPLPNVHQSTLISIR